MSDIKLVVETGINAMLSYSIANQDRDITFVPLRPMSTRPHLLGSFAGGCGCGKQVKRKIGIRSRNMSHNRRKRRVTLRQH